MEVDNYNLDYPIPEDPGDGSTLLDGVWIPPAPIPSTENSGPRLIITQMVCRDFKSYAGTKTLGPFHARFTSIVGPNGSGKSNVIDSMLFVFGYRAQKIRSKKISVLIHNSSEHPDIRSCSVQVHFAKITPEEKIIPGTDFVVSRTAFKDNSSHYEINGKKKLFKEVAKLLRAEGIDLDHNRFLILQGEVEQIALMKPKAQDDESSGMLEFLEDIIGSSRLKNPIEVFKERVAELDGARSEKLNRVKLVENEKDELEGPKNEALEYLKLENEVAFRKNAVYQKNIHDSEVKIQGLQEKKIEFEEFSKELINSLNDIAETKKNAESKLDDIQKETEFLTAGVEKANEDYKKHELEDEKVLEEMKATNVKRKKIMAQVKSEKENFEKWSNMPKVNELQIKECTKKRDKLIQNVETETTNYNEALEALREETKSYTDQKETQETKLIDLKKVVNEKESQVSVVQSSLDIETSKEKKEAAKLESIQTELKTSQESIKSKEQELAKINQSLPKSKQKLQDLTQEMEKITSKVEKYESSLKGAQLSYEETRTAHAASKTRGKVHAALMEQKSAGNIVGIHGRLGDLGAIDKKYDIAVSTAGGGALDTIIVEDVGTGKACIEFLRKHELGRANFLALDKTKVWKSNISTQFSAPEGVPRLFDLITVKDVKFKTAFYHYLQDTLVAEELSQAQRIAFGKTRFRVVTLDGEVIEKSGAMSGGGREKARGKMGSQVASFIDPGALSQLEEALRTKEANHREALTLKNELEKSHYELEKSSKEMEESLRQIAFEISSSKDQIKLLTSAITQQKEICSNNKTDVKKVKELTKELKGLQAELQSAQEAASEVEEKVGFFNAKIKEIMSLKVSAHKKKLSETTNKLNKIKNEITKLEVEIKSSQRNAEKAKAKFTEYEAEVIECESSMKAMKAKREELDALGEEINSNLQKLAEKQKVKLAEYQKEKESVNAVLAEEKKFKSKKIDLQDKLSFFTNALNSQKDIISGIELRLKKLELKDIPGEEVEVLPKISSEELSEMNLKSLEAKLGSAVNNLGNLKPNLAAIAEFNRKEAIYLERVSELDNLTTKRDSQKKNYEDLRKQRVTEFLAGFTIITSKLKEMYQMITMGGDAELELVDSLDPFIEGIVFSVRPPKKSWKQISNLSGGEKTLSSLALVFALHYYKPTPLYVMDEIDAALDFKNVSIVANYIKERTKNAQFIIISLRANMFELADRLVGIYKTHNATKSVTIDPTRMQAKEETTDDQTSESTVKEVTPRKSSRLSKSISSSGDVNEQHQEPSASPLLTSNS